MDWKPLIEGWLEDARSSAEVASRQPNGSRYKIRVYERALDAVRDHDSAVMDPRELQQLPGIGEKTVNMLGSKIKQYCKKNGDVSLPPSLQMSTAPAPSFELPAKDSQGLRQSFPFAPPPKRQTGRIYVPKYGSAPYHVLVGMRLYELGDDSKQGIGQSELTRQIKSRTAGALEGAVSRSSPSIGTALKTLRDHECVYMRNSRYFLDQKGRDLANGFLHAEGLAQAIPPAPSATYDASTTSNASEIEPNSFSSEVWYPGSYKVKLVLDNREVASKHDRSGLIDDLKATGISMDVQALCLGDALWIAEHEQSRRRAVLDYIVERKTLSDLRASIHDGRYHEQKKRLVKSTLPQVVYLIEQPNNVQNNELYRDNKQKFDTALSQTIAMHKFHLKQSRSQNDTVLYLSTLTTMLAQEYRDRPLNVVVPNVMTYEASMKAARSQIDRNVAIDFSSFDEALRKSKLMTIGETFRVMLRAIKGVSAEKAMSIQRVYPTPAHLMRAYEQQPTEEAAKNMVYEATLHCATRQQIRPALSALVYEVWHP